MKKKTTILVILSVLCLVAVLSVFVGCSKVGSNMFTSNEEGTFYMIYKSSCFKYGQLFKVEKIRLISFVEASEPGERLD